MFSVTIRAIQEEDSMPSQNQEVLVHWVLVANGKQAKIYSYQNLTNEVAGSHSVRRPNYVETHSHEWVPVPEMHFLAEKPSDFEMGHDKLGSVHESATNARHSNTPRTDIHEQIMDRFVKTIATKFKQITSTEKPFDELTLVAPSRMIHELEKQLPTDVSNRVIAKIQKDLTHYGPHDLRKHLNAFELVSQEKIA